MSVDLHSLLCAEVAEGVAQMLLYPARQLAALVRAAESLVREYHYTVIRFASGKQYILRILLVLSLSN